MNTSTIQHDYSYLQGPKWSHAEKAIARKAFDQALKQELDEVIQHTKAMVAKIKEPDDLWDVEFYLTQRRKEINREYDYRYSVLPVVFANLVRTGRLTEANLQGLKEDKLTYVRLLTKT